MKPSSSTSEDEELASFCAPARDPTLTGGLQACHLESGGDGRSRVSRTACASNCRWAMNRLTQKTHAVSTTRFATYNALSAQRNATAESSVNWTLKMPAENERRISAPLPVRMRLWAASHGSRSRRGTRPQATRTEIQSGLPISAPRGAALRYTRPNAVAP